MATRVLVSLGLSLLVLAGCAPMRRAEPSVPSTRARVDFFDLQSHRTGYAIVDCATGRVDFYDANSRRTGWGKMDRWDRERVERFDLTGRREAETALPPCP